MPAITGFHHVSFTVSDRQKSVGWYAEVMGFEVHSEVEADTSAAPGCASPIRAS